MGGAPRKYLNKKTQEAAAEGSSLTSPPLNEESTSHATRSSTAGYSTPPHHLMTSSETQSESDTRRVVILGKTGAGKSSLANTILGEKPFKVDDTANSGTKECQAETRSVNGRNITLIDTPGFFDTDKSEEELKPEMLRCITECAPGPHVFLIVLKVEKFIEQEQAVIDKICQYFSEEVFKYASIVFTHGDQLLEGETIKNFVDQNHFVTDLVKKCGGRCHVIDNKYWNNQQDEYRSNQFQVKELLMSVDKTTEANKGGCYTNEMLQAVEDKIKQEEESIRKSPGNMSMIQLVDCAKGELVSTYTGARNGMMRLPDAAEGADTPQITAETAEEAVENETCSF